MTQTDDLELLQSHIDGDQSAFALLMARHKDWIFNAARRRLNDGHLADDAAQAVFMLLAEKADDVLKSNIPSLSAWLFRTLHFTCLNIRRTRERSARRESAVGWIPPRDDGVDESLPALLEETIAQLPPRDREAIVRRFYQRQTFTDVGVALQISEEAARKRVTRILSHCRASMSLAGVDATPGEWLDRDTTEAPTKPSRAIIENQNIKTLAEGTWNMVEQTESMRFSVMTAEFTVRSVEDNLDFFEKLGFRRHFVEAGDGAAVRASLRGGHARIWLKRATTDQPPAPGVAVYVWLDGGEQAVIRHRQSIAAHGVAVNQFFYDGAMMNFTVTTPDGYTVGFFSTYQPHTFDLALDG